MNYVRDTKNITIRYDHKIYAFSVVVKIKENKTLHARLVNLGDGLIYEAHWGYWFYTTKQLPVLRFYNGSQINRIHDRRIAMECFLEYERLLNREKGISPCPTRQMSESERAAAPKLDKEYLNYSNSAEYRSGVPYYFHRAKTEVVCAKNSIKVLAYIRRTYFADPEIAALYRKYRGKCRDCNKRATCSLPCLTTDEKEYVMSYIRNLQLSQEVIDFKNNERREAI